MYVLLAGVQHHLLKSEGALHKMIKNNVKRQAVLLVDVHSTHSQTVLWIS